MGTDPYSIDPHHDLVQDHTASAFAVAILPSRFGFTKVNCVCRRFATRFGSACWRFRRAPLLIRLSSVSWPSAVLPPVMAATERRRPLEALLAMRWCIASVGGSAVASVGAALGSPGGRAVRGTWGALACAVRGLGGALATGAGA